MSNRVEQTMSVFGIMSLAAMIGAAAALLFAPRKGSETRQRLKLKIHDAKVASDDTIDNAKTKAQLSIDKLRHKADHVSDEVSDAIADARIQAEDLVSDAKTRARRANDATIL